MRFFIFAAIAAATLLGGLNAARATSLVVPDGAATVQQALDASVDTVYVKDGVVPERVTVSGSVVLMPVVDPAYPGFSSYPSLRSIEVSDGYLTMRGFRLLGRFVGAPHQGVDFAGCRFDSALTASIPAPDVGPTRLEGCLVLGDLTVQAQRFQLIGNTVIGGTMTAEGDGRHDIRGNYVTGAPGAGIHLKLWETEGMVEGNTITDCGEGIRILSAGEGPIRSNVIAGCAGNGITFEDRASQAIGRDIASNSIHDCGGAGIRAGTHWSVWRIRLNRILDVGGDGIAHSGSSVFAVDSNTVLRAGGAGIRSVAFTPVLRGNVVGRCGSDGIVLAAAADPRLLEHNTSFANAGAGFSLAGTTWPAPDTVRLNIAALNSGAGFAHTAGPAPLLSCNDWFANTGGATQGMAPGPTDLEIDPQFCQLPGNDVHLASGSALLAAPGCGTIGALGEGCATPLGVPNAPRLATAALRARPVPASGRVVFEVAPSEARARLEVFDVSGARRWAAELPAGSAGREWNARDTAGRRVPPGVYFARLSRGGAPAATTRVVLTE